MYVTVITEDYESGVIDVSLSEDEQLVSEWPFSVRMRRKDGVTAFCEVGANVEQLERFVFQAVAALQEYKERKGQSGQRLHVLREERKAV